MRVALVTTLDRSKWSPFTRMLVDFYEFEPTLVDENKIQGREPVGYIYDEVWQEP